MRGIQINNYVNNNISLGGRKINNQHPSQINQPMRPTPLVVNHLFNHQDVEQIIITQSKSPQIKLRTKDTTNSARKKRANTLLIPNTQITQIKRKKQKISTSMQYLKKGATSPFKDLEKDSEEDKINGKNIKARTKKIKPSLSKIQKSNSVTVNRSKSTIIKNTQKNTQIQYTSRQFIKNQKTFKKKINDSNQSNANNTQNIERNKPKKGLKKQTQQWLEQKKKISRNKAVDVDSDQVKGKKESDKVVLDLKFMKFETQKKSARTTITKSFLTSAKQSKPVSARQKKIKKNLFDQSQMKKGIDKTDLELNLKQLNGENQNEESDVEVQEAITKFQKVIQKFDSKKALAGQIKKLTKKIEKLISRKNSRQNSSDSQTEKNINFIQVKKLKKVNSKNKSRDRCHINEGKQSVSKKASSKKLKNKKNDEKIKKHNNKANQQSNNKDSYEKCENDKSQPSPFNYEQSDESKYIESKVQERDYQDHLLQDQSENDQPENSGKNGYIQNPKPFQQLNQEKSEILDENNAKYMEFLKNIYQNQEEQNLNSENHSIDDISSYLNNKIQYKENPKIFNNQFLQRKTYEKLIKFHENKDQQKDEKQSQLDSEDHQVFLQKREKEYEINKLKQFRKQSDKMMQKINNQKIKIEENRNKLTIQINQNNERHISREEKKSKISQLMNVNQNIKNPLSPKYTEHYPNFIKSPKYSQIEITNILAAKEKCLASKHEKMNELIQKMYQKQLVSPKSYEYSIYQLKKNFQQEYNTIDNFKSQASEILQQINSDKQQIKDIDQLIRQQKWEQARQLMKNKQNGKTTFKAFSKSKPRVYSHQQISESQIDKRNKQIEQEQGWQKVILEEQVPKKQLSLNEDKKNNFQVVKNNICINILPTVRKEVAYKEKQKSLRENLSSEQSQSSLNFQALANQLNNDINNDSILRSNMNEKVTKIKSDQFKKLQEQAIKYCSGSLDTENQEEYVYYESQQDQNQAYDSPILQCKNQSMFKLIKIQADGQENKEKQIQKNQKISEVIQIDDERQNLSEQEFSHKQKIHQIQALRKNQQKNIIKGESQKRFNDNDEYENESNSSLLELQLRRGFQSNLFFIKQYCISLCQYIRQIQLKKEEFKKNLTYPLQFNLTDLLKKYRRTIKGDYNNEYNSLKNDLSYFKDRKQPQAKAISQQLADEFNKSYTYLKFYNLDVSKKGREKFKMEKQAEKIFLTAILDAMNESLDFERPGSIFGKPLPWASNEKQLKNMKFLIENKKEKNSLDGEETAQCYDFMFGAAIARLIQWSSCLSGFLPDTAELQNTQIDENYVTHIRQTRMAFLLEKMLSEEQATINNSEMQQTQVMLFLGKQIMDQLINEAVQQILT